MNRKLIWVISSILAAALVVGAVAYFGQRPTVATTRPAPATQQTAATIPAVAASRPAVSAMLTYGDVLHADFHHYATTKPWATGVDLTYAAHLVLHEPVYVCSRGDLWITRSDGDPLPKVLGRAGKESEHITSAKIDYIVWTINQKNQSVAAAICRTDIGGCEMITASGRTPLPHNRDYQWDRAMTWDDNGVTRLIVPTGSGISILTVDKSISEQYQPLLDESAVKENPPPIVLFDLRGLLAWIPADGKFNSPAIPARYVDGKWQALDSADWKHPIIHLIPMLDGSVLQIRRGEADAVDLAIAPLDEPAVKREEIKKLVDDLADDDADKRKAAFDRLTQFGPGIFPILRELQPAALAESQARINELTQGKLAAKLGGMEVNDRRLTVAGRLQNGGVIFFAPAGVSTPHNGEEPTSTDTDYLLIEPGQAVLQLSSELQTQLTNGATISSIHEEWIVTTQQFGPARYLPPTQYSPLLHKGEENFTKVWAIDGHGRWLLKDPHIPTSQPSATLILDPTVPDPNPRLALWLISRGTDAGWNEEGWPTFKEGKELWAVTSTGWEKLPEGAVLLTDPPAARATTRAATSPTTTASTTLSDNEPAILYTKNGDRYQDGNHALVVTSSAGQTTTWPLPNTARAIVDERPWLVEANDGALFLINDADRIARILPTPDEAEPYELQTVFASQLPHFGSIRRAWLDPAGRLDIVYDEHYIAIIFPTGQIPKAASDKILPQNLRISEPH